MPAARLKNGLSLSQRIRSYANSVRPEVIAAELGTSIGTVNVVRAKAKRPGKYRADGCARQRKASAAKRAFAPYAWAHAYADSFVARPDSRLSPAGRISGEAGLCAFGAGASRPGRAERGCGSAPEAQRKSESGRAEGKTSP